MLSKRAEGAPPGVRSRLGGCGKSAGGAADSSKGPRGTLEQVTIDTMHFEFPPIIGALLTAGVISTLIWDWLRHPEIDGRTRRGARGASR